MEETFVPFRGIKNDLNGRLKCYKQDWTGGFRAGFRYVAVSFDYLSLHNVVFDYHHTIMIWIASLTLLFICSQYIMIANTRLF